MANVQLAVAGDDTTQVILSVPGVQGPTGSSIPPSGTTNQVLYKQSNTDYDTGWSLVTSAMIASGTIVNEDVNASAAIAGTKISPDFGSQNVVTTGTSTAASFIPTSSGIPTNGMYLPSANNVAISTNGTGRLFVDSSGNVGVGAAPSEKLHVSGDGIRIDRSAGEPYIDFYTSGSSNNVLVYGSSTGFRVHTGGSERLRITSTGELKHIGGGSEGSPGVYFAGSAPSNSLYVQATTGNVGLGTSSPSTALHVVGAVRSSGNSYLGPDGTNWDTAAAYIANGSYGGGVSFVDGSNGFTLFANNTGSRFNLAHAATGGTPTVGLVYTNAGRLGIGTSSVSAKLHVKETTQDTYSIVRLEGNNRGGEINFHNGTAIQSAIWGNSDTLNFSTGASYTQAMIIDSSQRVGIGTTSPLALLDVYKGSGSGYVDSIILSNSAAYGANQGIAWGSTSNISARIKGLDDGAYGTHIIFENRTGGPSTSTTERARIDSSGRLLVGTSSVPSTGSSQYSLLVVRGYAGGATGAGDFSIQRGGTAASGFGANEQVGVLRFTDSDGYEFANIQCLTDGTAGSGDYPGRLVFSTTADGASSPTERMRISQAGHVYVANTTGDYNTVGITLFSNGQAQANASGVNPLNLNRKTNDGKIIDFYRDTNNPGGISVTTTSTTYATSSDYRLKENVVPLTDAIDRVNQLQVHRFNFIADPDKTVDGFIAHEAQAVVPECVTGEKDAVDDDGKPIYQGIDQSKLVPLLTAALQEAIAKIETLEAKVAALQAQ